MMMAAANHWMGGIAGSSHLRPGSAVSYQNHHKSQAESLWSNANRRRASIESNMSLATLHRRGSGGSILYPAVNYNVAHPRSNDKRMLNVTDACETDSEINDNGAGRLSRKASSKPKPKETEQYDNSAFTASPKDLSTQNHQVCSSSSDSSGFVTGENLTHLPGQVGTADEAPVFFFGRNSKNNK